MMSYGTGVELKINRMTAYELHRKACKACCDFLADQFASMKSLDEQAVDLHFLVASLQQIQNAVDDLDVEGDA